MAVPRLKTPDRKAIENAQDPRPEFMREDDIRMVDDYLAVLNQNRGRMDGKFYTRWQKEHEAYLTDQAVIENRPNSRVNILHANVEGQVTALVEQNLSIVCRGEGPSDHGFAKWAEIGLDWTLRKNHFKTLLRTHEWRRELFGSSWFKVSWDPDFANGFGRAKFDTPPLQAMFVDMKINDPLLLQDAEYVAEVMLRSKPWAIAKYGDVAYNIRWGNTDRSPIFTKDRTIDDADGFWLIQLWAKDDGVLRLLEFSDDGVLLYDSFADEDVQKGRKPGEPYKPFYRKNLYPYFFTIMYPEEGEFHGFGGGKLLLPLQDMINDFYDQIRIAALPDMVFFDPTSEVDLTDLGTNRDPHPAIDPTRNIHVVSVGDVNPAYFQLLANIENEVQKVTRYGEMMLGQGSSKKETATKAAIQQQEANKTTDFKKTMLEDTLTGLLEYALDLYMEHVTEGRAFRLDEDANDYDWVDFRAMNETPILIPADDAHIKQFRTKNPDAETPKWMVLTNDQGKPATKAVELDIEISIGAGLPKNKAFLWKMIEQLAGIQIDNRSVISWKEFRALARDFAGLPLDDDQEAAQQGAQPMPPEGAPPGGAPPPGGQPPPGAPPGGPPGGGAPMPSPTVPGGTMNAPPNPVAMGAPQPGGVTL